MPQAHRGLLRNVKDLTEPTANIEVGSAILYGYMRSANGDLNAALKNYGGSKAYAQKVSLRAEDFAEIASPQVLGQPSATAADTCKDDRCAAPGYWANAFTVPAITATAQASGAAAGGVPAASH